MLSFQVTYQTRVSFCFVFYLLAIIQFHILDLLYCSLQITYVFLLNFPIFWFTFIIYVILFTFFFLLLLLLLIIIIIFHFFFLFILTNNKEIMLVFTKMKVCYTNYATYKGREAALNDKMIRRIQTTINYTLKEWSITPSLSASDRMSVQDKGLSLSLSVMTYIWQ